MFTDYIVFNIIELWGIEFLSYLLFSKISGFSCRLLKVINFNVQFDNAVKSIQTDQDIFILREMDRLARLRSFIIPVLKWKIPLARVQHVILLLATIAHLTIVERNLLVYITRELFFKKSCELLLAWWCVHLPSFDFTLGRSLRPHKFLFKKNEAVTLN